MIEHSYLVWVVCVSEACFLVLVVPWFCLAAVLLPSSQPSQRLPLGPHLLFSYCSNCQSHPSRCCPRRRTLSLSRMAHHHHRLHRTSSDLHHCFPITVAHHRPEKSNSVLLAHFAYEMEWLQRQQQASLVAEAVEFAASPESLALYECAKLQQNRHHVPSQARTQVNSTGRRACALRTALQASRERESTITRPTVQLIHPECTSTAGAS